MNLYGWVDVSSKPSTSRTQNQSFPYKYITIYDKGEKRILCTKPYDNRVSVYICLFIVLVQNVCQQP